MDLNVCASAFGLIFLAEMGDKTQLAVVSMAASTRRPIEVFMGAVAALVAVTLIGVVAGHFLGAYIPKNLLQYIAGSAFIVMGALMLVGKM